MDDFVHIAKTSGSSLRTILAQQYGIDNIYYYEPGNPRLQGRDAVAALKEELGRRAIELIAGHHFFGTHRAIYQPLRYFSMLRDPISRAASEYFYAYAYKHHRLRDEILSGALTPEAFLIDGQGGNNFALQSRMIAGSGGGVTNLAKLAFETVQRSFVVVGVAEIFSESVLYMAKRLGWKPPLYATRNVTRLDPELERTRRRVEDRVRTEFADRYAADIELHERVNAKLRRDIHAEGAPFAHALAAFQEIQGFIERSDASRKYEQYDFAATDHLPDLASGLAGSTPYRVLQDYLAAGDLPTVRPPNYLGNVDIIKGRAVAGWAVDLAADEPIEVRVYDSGRQIGAALAKDERPDVKQARGIRSNVGFFVRLDEEIRSHMDVYACFEATEIRI